MDGIWTPLHDESRWSQNQTETKINDYDDLLEFFIARMLLVEIYKELDI